MNIVKNVQGIIQTISLQHFLIQKQIGFNNQRRETVLHTINYGMKMIGKQIFDDVRFKWNYIIILTLFVILLSWHRIGRQLRDTLKGKKPTTYKIAHFIVTLTRIKIIDKLELFII